MDRYEARREVQHAIYDVHTLAWRLTVLVSVTLLISGTALALVSYFRSYHPVVYVLGALLIIAGDFCGSRAEKVLDRRAAVVRELLDVHILYLDLARVMRKCDEWLLEQSIIALANEHLRDEVKRDLARIRAALKQDH